MVSRKELLGSDESQKKSLCKKIKIIEVTCKCSQSPLCQGLSRFRPRWSPEMWSNFEIYIQCIIQAMFSRNAMRSNFQSEKRSNFKMFRCIQYCSICWHGAKNNSGQCTGWLFQCPLFSTKIKTANKPTEGPPRLRSLWKNGSGRIYFISVLNRERVGGRRRWQLKITLYINRLVRQS